MDDTGLTGDHKAQLLSDAIHGAVVMFVCLLTFLALVLNVGLPTDVAGTVFGGSIGYAAGRAGNIARSRRTNGAGG